VCLKEADDPVTHLTNGSGEPDEVTGLLDDVKLSVGHVLATDSP
jgi:hypothetical protein